MKLLKHLTVREIKDKGRDLSVILVLSTIFFSFGYIISIIDYAIEQKTALLWGNVISTILIWFIYLLYRGKRISLNSSLLIHIVVVSVNLYYGILHEAFIGKNNSILHVVECMCVCMIPAVLAGMTHWRWLPTLVATGAIICYVIAGISMGNPENMITHAPAFAIVMVGLGFTFSYLLKLNRIMEKENIQVKIEQQNILRMLDLTPKQWELIKQGRMSQKRMEKLLLNITGATKEKMLYKMKNIVQNEEEIKEAIRTKHPHLSAGDMELCVLIVQRKSVTQIAKLQSIKTHSVTARRSRLRTKLGLEKEQNLNDYLLSVARREV